MNQFNRQPVVAGTFYPGSEKLVEKQLTEFLSSDKNFSNAFGAVVPHAGWACSGEAAGKVFSSLEPCDTYIIIGPNHNGIGAGISIMTEGEWILPNGNIKIDSELSKEILNNSNTVMDDPSSHSREHSIEVQLPFIIKQNPAAKFVPISMFNYSLKSIYNIADAIVKALENYKEKTLIIASSDMSHYETADFARAQDFKAINKILELNTKGLNEIVNNEQITMCGLGPVSVVIEVTKKIGAKKGELIIYTNSGETCAPGSPEVVGYAGIVFI
ncbi:AmmeMemoRadiSam system protein B [Candidatus Dependentiae bacterium]|nr:AmmeMemoRadiSam system protein B [Candidatus Dependentiae bacterium]